MNAVIRPMPIITSTGTGSQPPRVSPRWDTESGKAIGEPWEITRDRPRATDSMASVAMNDGSFPYDTRMPLTRPQAMPVAMASSTARTTGTPAEVALQASTVADRAATEPTDRSMPAETMTKVTPKARIATTAAWTPMLSRLSAVRKSPDSADMAMTRTMSAVSAPLSRSRRRRPPGAPPCAPGLLLSVSVATGGLRSVAVGAVVRPGGAGGVCGAEGGACGAGRGACGAGRGADGEGHHGVLGGVLGGQFAGDPALRHDDDPVAHAEHLGQITGDHEHRGARGRQFVDQLVDLDLRADVDAARRLVEDQHLGVRQQPLADDDLLLVAAGQRPHVLPEARHAHPELPRDAVRRLVLS